MDALGPIAIAVVTTIGGIIATAFAARRLGKLGMGAAQLEVNKTLRELADAKSAEAEVWQKRYESLVKTSGDDLATMTAERNRYRTEADDAGRRLDGAYAELRRTGRLVDRRGEPRL